MGNCISPYPQQTIANVASSAQPAGSGNGSAQDVSGYHFVLIVVQVTTMSGSGSFSVQQEGPDSLWYPIAVVPGSGSDLSPGVTITGTGQTVIRIGGVTGAATVTGGVPTLPFTSTIRLTWNLPAGGATFSYWMVGQA